MKKIYSSKLKKGDEIRVITPARSLKIISQETRKVADKALTELGLKITFGKNVNELDQFLSSSIKSRVSDFHQAFRDKKVKAVISVIGGFNSNQLLNYIDWDLIKSNPKIFCGYSDITALNNAIFAKTGLINYSGPAYSTFGKILDNKYTVEYFEKCLFGNAPIDLKPSKKWDDRKWWLDQKNRKFFRNTGWQVINKGKAEGIILGANLCTFNLLQGTEYFPGLKNSILFLEDDYESNAQHFDRDLQSLIHLPDFKYVKGLIIGRFQKASEISEKTLKLIIKSKKELDKIPVIANVDFGHTSPLITFPIGGTVKIRAGKSSSQIKIIKH